MMIEVGHANDKFKREQVIKPSAPTPAHEPERGEAEADKPCAERGKRHADVFCECHRFTDPKPLPNGSDIAWPAGWGEKEAEGGRRRHNSARPSEPDGSP